MDADRHPDLFWASRGGGGNFGVVTPVQFRLHPLEGGYVNFLGERQKARDACPGATWDRLVAVERRYDPTNVFRLNSNTPPTVA